MGDTLNNRNAYSMGSIASDAVRQVIEALQRDLIDSIPTIDGDATALNFAEQVKAVERLEAAAAQLAALIGNAVQKVTSGVCSPAHLESCGLVRRENAELVKYYFEKNNGAMRLIRKDALGRTLPIALNLYRGEALTGLAVLADQTGRADRMLVISGQGCHRAQEIGPLHDGSIQLRELQFPGDTDCLSHLSIDREAPVFWLDPQERRYAQSTGTGKPQSFNVPIPLSRAESLRSAAVKNTALHEPMPANALALLLGEPPAFPAGDTVTPEAIRTLLTNALRVADQIVQFGVTSGLTRQSDVCSAVKIGPPCHLLMNDPRSKTPSTVQIGTDQQSLVIRNLIDGREARWQIDRQYTWLFSAVQAIALDYDPGSQTEQLYLFFAGRLSLAKLLLTSTNIPGGSAIAPGLLMLRSTGTAARVAPEALTVGVGQRIFVRMDDQSLFRAGEFLPQIADDLHRGWPLVLGQAIGLPLHVVP